MARGGRETVEAAICSIRGVVARHTATRRPWSGMKLVFGAAVLGAATISWRLVEIAGVERVEWTHSRG